IIFPYLLYCKSFKNPSFFIKNLNNKALQQNAKGLEMSWLPQENDFRTFCMNGEAEKDFSHSCYYNQNRIIELE
ncbi:unnamed protein product, partial [marine sediment metagenome]